MAQFKKFKNRIFTESGFYVLRDRQGKEEEVYASVPTHHYSNVYSFFITYPNTRENTYNCDFGIYRWVNNFLGSTHKQPVEWREMTDKEIKEFRKKLYNFDREKN